MLYRTLPYCSESYSHDLTFYMELSALGETAIIHLAQLSQYCNPPSHRMPATSCILQLRLGAKAHIRNVYILLFAYSYLKQDFIYAYFVYFWRILNFRNLDEIK